MFPYDRHLNGTSTAERQHGINIGTGQALAEERRELDKLRAELGLAKSANIYRPGGRSPNH